MSCSTKLTKRGRKNKNSSAPGGAHLSKILLESLSSGQEDPIWAYRKYLQATLNFNVSHAFIASMPGELLDKF
jgi:hypothetical protein